MRPAKGGGVARLEGVEGASKSSLKFSSISFPSSVRASELSPDFRRFEESEFLLEEFIVVICSLESVKDSALEVPRELLELEGPWEPLLLEADSSF